MRHVRGLACWAILLLLASCGGGESPAVDASAPAAVVTGSPLRVAARQSAAQAPSVAAKVLDNNALFQWAQWHYSQYFAGGYETGTYQGFQYRYYPQTKNYLAVNSGWVYVLGPSLTPGGTPLSVGSLPSFECLVYPSNCPVTATPASNGIAFSGIYSGDINGASPDAYMLVAADGSFVGYNVNSLGTQTDLFTGTAVAQASSWSATNASFVKITSTATAPGTVNITGSYSVATSATATLAVTGTTASGSHLAWTYDSQSRNPSSLAIAGGLYVTPSLGQSVMINEATGAVSGNFGTGCTISGTLSAPEPARNIYKMQATLTGSTCPYQGTAQFLAVYDSLYSPQTLAFYGTPTSGTQTLVWMYFLRDGDG
jgi:hypothetical protein